MSGESSEFLESIERLTRDLRNAAVTLGEREARFLVDAYYLMQRDRIRTAHQYRSLAQNAEPHVILGWLQGQRGTLERQIARALDAYSAGIPAGRWARSITGIGPIISAGLICHLRIRDTKVIGKHDDGTPITQEVIHHTAGSFWRFAGLDPTLVWAKGTKRPWNGSLKRLCFLIGESFVKVSNLESDYYGKIYKERKEYETHKNEAGDYADQAKAALEAKRYGDDTQAKKHYEAGKLPPARIHLRSERVAVKRFLADLHHVMYELETGEKPPKPWAITIGGHAHYVPPPNWPMVE